MEGGAHAGAPVGPSSTGASPSGGALGIERRPSGKVASGGTNLEITEARLAMACTTIC